MYQSSNPFGGARLYLRLYSTTASSRVLLALSSFFCHLSSAVLMSSKMGWAPSGFISSIPFGRYLCHPSGLTVFDGGASGFCGEGGRRTTAVSSCCGTERQGWGCRAGPDEPPTSRSGRKERGERHEKMETKEVSVVENKMMATTNAMRRY